MLTTVCLLLGCIWLLYKFWTKDYGYWKSLGFPELEARFPYGSIWTVVTMTEYQGSAYQEAYKKLGNLPYGGLFIIRRPILMIKDLDLLKHILVKDFSQFRDRSRTGNISQDVLAQNLFNLTGDQWKAVRTKLSPTFSSGKLKAMFPLFQTCSLKLDKVLQEKANAGAVVNIKDLMSNFTTDIIGTCAFGLEINAFDNPDSMFRKIGHGIFPSTIKPSLQFKLLSTYALPKLQDLYRFSLFDKEVKDFLMNVISNTVNYREKNKVIRHDFLDLLIQLRNDSSLEPGVEKGTNNLEISMELMVAQCFAFYAAGFETSSSAMSYCFFELALHPEIQEKVRQEVDAVSKKHGGITYEALQEMPYLDQVVSETLRKYPTLPILNRTCCAPYKLPDGSGLTIQEGTRLVIPLYAIHHDPKYFPDPERFDPERFSVENKPSIHPFTYLPFGEGPRNCIGMRFGLLQTKIGIAMLISKYKLSPTPKTQVPLEFVASTLVTTTKGPIWLQLNNRSS